MHYRLFPRDTCLVEIQSTEKYAAIHEVISKSGAFAGDLDEATFEAAVVARERLQSTGVGHGVAFAHGKTAGISTLRVALGVSRNGVAFDSADGQPVRLLFVVGTNPEHHIDYLRCLSRLAAILRCEKFRTELLGCVCAEDIEHKLDYAFGLQGLEAAC